MDATLHDGASKIGGVSFSVVREDSHLLDALDDGLPVQVHLALIELDAVHTQEALRSRQFIRHRKYESSPRFCMRSTHVDYQQTFQHEAVLTFYRVAICHDWNGQGPYPDFLYVLCGDGIYSHNVLCEVLHSTSNC